MMHGGMRNAKPRAASAPTAMERVEAQARQSQSQSPSQSRRVHAMSIAKM